MSVFHNNALIGAGGGTAAAAAAANITKSLRFNSGDSSSLTRTPSSAGNRKTWTWAAWVKISKTDSTARLFQARDGSSGNQTFIQLRNNNKIYVAGNSDAFTVNTDALFRDPGAWGHLCVSFDTTQSTAADRIRIFWNGVQQDVSGTQPSQDYSTAQINTTLLHSVGNDPGTNGEFFNGYLADVYLIDGSRLDPTSFGAFDDNGVFQAAGYSGTFGTNGFHLLDFENESTLGHDSSGNDNDFTANNLVASTPGLSTAQDGFNALLWSGNNSSGRNITGLSFTPDFVWIKNRTNTSGYGHILVDIARTAGRYMRSDANTAESVFGYVSAFVSGGFTVSNHREVNGSGDDYIAWCWKAGGSASSNTDGSITSNVSVSTTYGFSCLTYTGNGSTGTVGHGLGAVPKWIIIKNRSTGSNGYVYHDALGTSKALLLNQTANEFTPSPAGVSAVSTSTFSLGGARGETNTSGDDYVAYVWCEKSGFSKFGSYVGNNSSDGPVITTGFKPIFVMIKGASSGINDSWKIYDTVRSNTGNPVNDFLMPNNGDEEAVNNTNQINMLDDGFQITSSPNLDTNLNGKTYVYMAFAQEPNPGDLDVLFDVPVNGDQSDTGAGGEVSGNYCTLNPLDQNGGTLSNGSLDYDLGSGTKFSSGTIAVKSGKWFWEAKAVSGVTSGSVGGRFAISQIPSERHGENGPFTLFWHATGGIRTAINGTITSRLTGTNYADSDILGLALDADANIAYFYKNGSLVYTYDFSSLVAAGSQFLAPSCWNGSNGSPVWTYNFGQRAFKHSARTNHKCLVSTNLPTPTIADGSDYFDTKIYTGNGSSQTISGFSFSPDFAWFKNRATTKDPRITDIIRGTGVELYSSGDGAQFSQAQGVTAFNSDGVSVGSDGGYNGSSNGMVLWAWDGGSSTASNTDGDITSSVRANQSSGFSIVTFTQSGSSGQTPTVGHGLSAEPELILLKSRSNTQAWRVYHSATGVNKTIALNLSDAAVTPSSPPVWSVSSSTFGAKNGQIVDSGFTYVAYCFAPVSGFSAMGLYESNNSADGPFIFTNFRPAFILFKANASNQPWIIHDSVRNGINQTNQYLMPSNNSAELSDNGIDILSNGWKIRNNNAAWNGSSGTEYIWYAAAENPFQANGGLAR